MPKRKEPELDPKEQFKRFQETAKELGVDEYQASKSFTKVVKASPERKASSQSKAKSR